MAEKSSSESKTKRKTRTIDERIAELKEKQQAQQARRLSVVDKQLDNARTVLANAEERVKNAKARVAELESERSELAGDDVKDAPAETPLQS